MNPPSFKRELWVVTRILLGAAACTAVLFGIAAVLNHFFGQVAALIIVYAVLFTGMVTVGAWWVYREKLRGWHEREQIVRKLRGIDE